VAVAESPHLQKLSSLDMSGNHFGAKGEQALRERFGDRVAC
jgi:hypothetical protein